jgi:hypothetical protein
MSFKKDEILFRDSRFIMAGFLLVALMTSILVNYQNML